MIQLDGAMGEGGGQILRTSLGLSMVTGKPFRIENIRANREKPGLLRQHLTAVLAAAEICSAKTDGAELRSRMLTFEPREVRPGAYHFDIGSAGSTTLVLQAILPGLLATTGPTTVTLEGGTHNPFAPPFDFLQKAFLPIVQRMGGHVELNLIRAGFAPRGGGKLEVRVTPGQLKAIELKHRGPIVRQAFTAITAALPADIARRKLGWPADSFRHVALPDDQGPGNLVSVEIETQDVTEVFTGFGMRGRRAETVAEGVVRDVKHYLSADVPVGECLADQLLVPMALAGGGTYLTQAPSRHTVTNIDVVKAFLPVDVSATEVARGQHLVEISSAG
jgi:RNA 3'-terminal phosphate cyclase (ATP)